MKGIDLSYQLICITNYFAPCGPYVLNSTWEIFALLGCKVNNLTFTRGAEVLVLALCGHYWLK